MEDLNNSLMLISQYIKGVWRKKKLIIIASWLICPIGFILVSGMPDQYKSQAKIYADTRSILKPLLEGLAVQTNHDSDIKLIARTLLARPNVEDIARETDLDISVTNAKSYDDLINNLTKSIKIKSAGRQNLYTISYLHEDPKIAKKVVSATVNKFVESTLGQNRQDSDKASNFINVQLQEYVERLAQAERNLANFKKNYNGLMPGDDSSYYRDISVLTKQIEDVNLEISEKETILAKVKERILATTEPNSEGAQSGIATQYDERIDSLKTSLDDLLIRYTEAHPDIIETRRRLKYLENLRKKEIKSVSSYTAEGNIPTGQLSENVVVQQLSIQINELEGEIASLLVRKKRHSDALAELNSKVDVLPDIEAKLTALNRDYDITKRKYEELLTRKESADLSRKADESSEDIQFKVIEPPRVPVSPTDSKRAIYYTLVLVVGFGIGAGLAFLLSQLQPVVCSAAQLLNATGRPTFGYVSHIDIKSIKQKNTKRAIIFISLSGVLLSIYLVFMASEILFNQSLTEKYNHYIKSPSSIIERIF